MILVNISAVGNLDDLDLDAGQLLPFRAGEVQRVERLQARLPDDGDRSRRSTSSPPGPRDRRRDWARAGRAMPRAAAALDVCSKRRLVIFMCFPPFDWLSAGFVRAGSLSRSNALLPSSCRGRHAARAPSALRHAFPPSTCRLTMPAGTSPCFSASTARTSAAPLPAKHSSVQHSACGADDDVVELREAARPAAPARPRRRRGRRRRCGRRQGPRSSAFWSTIGPRAVLMR